MTCRCGSPAVQSICAIDFCAACADAFLEPIRARHIAVDEGGIGIGRQVGLLRPDWGEAWAELGCSICSATWTGPVGEPCTWCLDRHEAIIGAQRSVLLRPDLPDVGDPNRLEALKAWVNRLAHATKAGLIAEHEARAVLRRDDSRRVA